MILEISNQMDSLLLKKKKKNLDFIIIRVITDVFGYRL